VPSTPAETPNALLEVGRIGRPHGVRGDLYVSLTTNRYERLAVGARLLAGKTWLTVERSKPHPPRFIVHFVGVDDRTAAEAWTNALLRAEPLPQQTSAGNDVAEDELWIHELIGATVVDQHGISRGRCVSVIDNPAHDILELDDGALVPVRFVLSCRDGVISIDAPDGLFDLA
jgi:16S rRNA processing protein RimM